LGGSAACAGLAQHRPHSCVSRHRRLGNTQV